MNNLLNIRGTLGRSRNSRGGGGLSFNKDQSVTIDQLQRLYKELLQIKNDWQGREIINGILISVKYCRVIPKSKRINKLFSIGSKPSNDFIRGARFEEYNHKRVHAVTYYISERQLDKSIRILEECQKILKNEFNGIIDEATINCPKPGKKRQKWERRQKLLTNKISKKYSISYNNFRAYIVDISNVVEFKIPDNGSDSIGESIITIYETDSDIRSIMSKLNIDISENAYIDKTTLRLNDESYSRLRRKAPYLIAMSVTDIVGYDVECFGELKEALIQIPSPTNEPVVGVIDTLFDDSVYFKEWVEFEDYTDPSIDRDERSFKHGTEIASIIVDGPNINPELDDGCGRFRVKHFGVALYGKNSSVSIMRNIESIVKENPQIKVWNLSLGTESEINDNFVSIEAAKLDELQYKYNVIFVVAGANIPENRDGKMKIGRPADSINSIVVNSVNEEGNMASYSRHGPVLSFFCKPDVCYYGGDEHDGKGKYIRTCTALGENKSMGTSLAAAWITRKVAFMVEKMGLSREIAKALLIDSAIGWECFDIDNSFYYGYGIVPKRIEDIVSSPNDEIKFYIEGVVKTYETYTYNIPIPLKSNKYPFLARITSCYFPRCSRNQGVDYTDTELDIYFGRIKNDGLISSINCNNQLEGKSTYVNEEDARNNYRKWDNVKHMNRQIKSRIDSLKSYELNKMWGFKIYAKNRLTTVQENPLHFGSVVTLKEINGENRIDEFKKKCSAAGWIVQEISIENKIDLYNKADIDINFD